MSLWITINPSDRHDPICQVFAGEHIDMDRFVPTEGPSALQRARNVACDPFAASQFFFFLAETILETHFGFSVNGRTAENRMGALGRGNAYFGVVEAQGRGSLHLHMVPPDPDSPNYPKDLALLEIRLAKSQQCHQCSPAACMRSIIALKGSAASDVLPLRYLLLTKSVRQES
jgi:hypothetical protein